MNSTHLKIWSASLAPTFDAAGSLTQLYELTVTFRKGGKEYRFWQAHVPDALRAVITDGSAHDIVIDTLDFSGLASKLLPNSPRYIVLAVTDASGERHCAMPIALTRLRWITWAAGLTAILGGIAALTWHDLPTWTGVIACVLGSHFVRAALQIPTSAEFDIY